MNDPLADDYPGDLDATALVQNALDRDAALRRERPDELPQEEPFRIISKGVDEPQASEGAPAPWWTLRQVDWSIAGAWCAVLALALLLVGLMLVTALPLGIRLIGCGIVLLTGAATVLRLVWKYG